MHFYKFYIFLLSILLISYCGGDTDTTITTTTSSTSTTVVETTSTNEKLVVWDEIITSDFQKIFADEETITLVNKYFDIVTVDKSTIYQQNYYEAISNTFK